MTGWIGWCWRKLHIRKWWRSWWCSVGSYHQVGEIIGDHIHLEAWFVCHTWYVLKDSYNTPSAGLFRRSISASRFQGWVSLQWSDIFELRFFWPAKDDFACISELRAHIYRVTGGVIKTGRLCVNPNLLLFFVRSCFITDSFCSFGIDWKFECGAKGTPCKKRWCASFILFHVATQSEFTIWISTRVSLRRDPS